MELEDIFVNINVLVFILKIFLSGNVSVLINFLKLFIYLPYVQYHYLKKKKFSGERSRSQSVILMTF